MKQGRRAEVTERRKHGERSQVKTDERRKRRRGKETGRGGGDDVRIQENREGERRIRKGK